MPELAASPVRAPIQELMVVAPNTIVDGHVIQLLRGGWELAAGGLAAPMDPASTAALSWSEAQVPGTVAAALRANGALDLDQVPDFDASVWWYRCHFESTPAAPDGERLVLHLDGLATIATVWLNGTRILESRNMFVAHSLDVTPLVREENTLVMRFASLRAALGTRRPRPRWRARLVEHQQLRWHRTSLLGRMPGWSPPVRPVGPWRGVRLERRSVIEVVRCTVQPRALERGGQVTVSAVVKALGGTQLRTAELRIGDVRAPLSLTAGDDAVLLEGTVAMPDAERWWPHTHGNQPRYEARVRLETSAGPIEIAVGHVAFRTLAVDRTDGGFGLVVNDVPVFCRGACWTTSDIVTLGGDEDRYRTLLALARDAGMNMLRVVGTMIYEDEVFYELCDQMGILVWQDFMFANMDYPADDAEFVNEVTCEAEQLLVRLAPRACLAVLCGNSEVEQQASMLGLEREWWSNALFQDLLPRMCAAHAPDVPYWSSSPTGGALPFHVDQGIAHYYGVGAYLLPLEDARRSGVRFVSECLGFANVPEPDAIERLLPNGEGPFHHPRWKMRVPRDQGAGWDFDDVRDHYLQMLFGVDPMRLRYSDMDRYLALSRVVTGEVMAQTIGEWRRQGSSCRGALVWFFQDLWLGAGWGVVDADAQPKAAYFALKRSMRPIALFATGEGANGVRLHLVNDTGKDVHGRLRLALLRGRDGVTMSVEREVVVAARGALTCDADALLGRFQDTAYAYRFGPPGHDTVVATLHAADGGLLAEVQHFPAGPSDMRWEGALVTGHAIATGLDAVTLRLTAHGHARYIALELDGWLPEDNYFHLQAGSERAVQCKRSGARVVFGGSVRALNATDGSRLRLLGTGDS